MQNHITATKYLINDKINKGLKAIKEVSKEQVKHAINDRFFFLSTNKYNSYLKDNNILYKNVIKCKFRPNYNPRYHEKEKIQKFRMIDTTRLVCLFNWEMELGKVQRQDLG